MAVPNSSAVHFPQTGIDVKKEDNENKEKNGGGAECGRKCHVRSMLMHSRNQYGGSQDWQFLDDNIFAFLN